MMAKFLPVIIFFVATACHQHETAASIQPINQDTRINVEDLVNQVFPNVERNSCMPGYDCVIHYQCSDITNSTIQDGAELIDLRAGKGSGCSHYLYRCCRISDMIHKPLITTISTPEGCGFRNVKGVGFTITGNYDNEAQFGEFPWMVAILAEEWILNKVFSAYKCGGSLIHPSVVLSAAHCLADTRAAKLKARAGEWDTQTKNEIIPHQDREVVNVVYHEQYRRRGLYNDIALLFLKSEFNLAGNVKPICLPPTNFNFDYSTCFATGWGKDVFGKHGKYQVILKKIDLPIIPRDTCQNQLRLTRLGENFQLHESFICAGGGRGKDTCQGDGGSPLVCPIPGTVNRYYQAGIVAWGIGCGVENVPGVYASVAKFRPWIDEQLKFLQ